MGLRKGLGKAMEGLGKGIEGLGKNIEGHREAIKGLAIFDFFTFPFVRPKRLFQGENGPFRPLSPPIFLQIVFEPSGG